MDEKEKEVKQAFEKLYKNWSDTVEKPPTMQQNAELENRKSTWDKMEKAFVDLVRFFKNNK